MTARHTEAIMERRRFGATDLEVSLVGFGAWAIGGPARAGSLPIGWGEVDDATSGAALRRAIELGVTLVDTADVYGLGHSEELVGHVVGNRPDIVVATKVGNRALDAGMGFDYSAPYILAACERSLRRLRRDTIDFYQLHTARLSHLEQGECVAAMERLRREGKIRYWGVSLATFNPAPEAEFLLQHRLGHGVQLVLNVLNQRAVPLLPRLAAAGYGVLARMPLQFGLLTGRIGVETRFGDDDHRSFRLTPEALTAIVPALEREVWPIAQRAGMAPAALALAFAASFPEVSSVIPGIRTPLQAEQNTAGPLVLAPETTAALRALPGGALEPVTALIERSG
jgi:aryl-alcohol dehydrogenase-like predicted oxidoreductase